MGDEDCRAIDKFKHSLWVLGLCEVDELADWYYNERLFEKEINDYHWLYGPAT